VHDNHDYSRSEWRLLSRPCRSDKFRVQPTSRSGGYRFTEKCTVTMAETLGIVIVLGIFVTIFVAVTYGVGILVISTPLVRWCLIAVVMFLAFRVLLLPLTFLSIWGTVHPEVTLEEEIRARTLIGFSTSMIPTRGSSKFTLLAQGSLASNSDRGIEGIAIYRRHRSSRRSAGRGRRRGRIGQKPESSGRAGFVPLSFST
jgi:hypothetical protein